MKKVLALVGVACLLGGCYTVVIDARDADMPMSMASKYGAGRFVGSFHAELHTQHLIGGLVTLGEPEVKKAIQQEVKNAGGREAANVRFSRQITFLDGLIGSVTLGIYTPTTLSIDGDVLK